MEKDDDEPNATEDSIERQIQQVIEKGIEDDEKEKSSQADDDDDDRKSDSKSKSNKSDSSDDEMERLRKEALSKYPADSFGRSGPDTIASVVSWFICSVQTSVKSF